MEGEQVRKYNSRGISKHNVVVTYPAYLASAAGKNNTTRKWMTSSFGKTTMGWSSYSLLKSRPKPDKEACTQSTAIFSLECVPLVEKHAQ